ncbi:hexameric tyrosine-coordinated heme protein [Motiliproteus sp. MSK22-1]
MRHQPADEIRKRLRPVYSEDLASLIASSPVIALSFQTISSANNYCN